MDKSRLLCFIFDLTCLDEELVCVQAMTNIDTDVHGTNGPRYVNSLYMQLKANNCCSLLNRGLLQDFTPTVS